MRKRPEASRRTEKKKPEMEKKKTEMEKKQTEMEKTKKKKKKKQKKALPSKTFRRHCLYLECKQIPAE